MPATHKNTPRSKRGRTQKPIAMPRAASSAIETALSQGARRALIAGVAVVAATAGAVIMRRGIGKLASGAASDAVAAGHSVGTLGHRIGKSLGKEVAELDLTRLLAYAGLRRRPSLWRRLAAPAGVLAALVAAGGSALFLLAPQLRGADDHDAPARDGKFTRPSIAKPSAIPEPDSNSMGSSNGSSGIDEIEQGVSHAVK